MLGLDVGDLAGADAVLSRAQAQSGSITRSSNHTLDAQLLKAKRSWPEPESGDGVTTPVLDVKDAYFSVNELPGNSRWRIGNFFVPFSLEQVTNDTMKVSITALSPCCDGRSLRAVP